MRDSIQRIAQGHGQHEKGEEGLARHLTKVGTLEEDCVGGGRVELGIAGNMIRNDQYQNESSNGYTNERRPTLCSLRLLRYEKLGLVAATRSNQDTGENWTTGNIDLYDIWV